MQFAEHVTDRQAADAVRAQTDWKYALCLQLDDPGFDCSVLRIASLKIALCSSACLTNNRTRR